MTEMLGRRPALTLLLLIAVLAVIPFVVTNPYYLHVLTIFLLFAIFASGWNLTLGILGLKTLGHHAFFALGAYGSAMLSHYAGVSPWATIWVGAGIAALAGLLIGVPILRIRSMPHVAIVTLAFAEIIRLVLANLKDWTRGELGFWGIDAMPALNLGGTVVEFGTGKPFGSYLLALAFFAGVHALLLVVLRGRIGLTLVAMRDSELAAESLAVDLTRWKLGVFAFSAAIVGLSGALYAHYIQILTPTSTVGPEMLVTLLAMIIVGGVGRFTGPILGALLLTVVGEALREFGDYRMLLYGGIVMLFVLGAPRGLAGWLALIGRRRAA
ncbi:branched-chain amino acid ABC transporter permease [Paracoccus luteus]|uniref:branched-chain amino acid ABC transporter permease n=1 Tax=Paracoccus luteus TaxID=2508543 RepID=UPI00106FA9F2|nr:branched-chain amino acid ABC transporter permease [Paracoccus luteus]